MRETFDAVVVGAGPAGSAAATAIVQRGHSVLVLEKDEFPRDKVCGELLSAEAGPALDRLAASAEIARARPERITRGAVYPAGGPAVPFDLPAPALGISRRAFDTLLARRSAEEGADVRFRHRVLSVEGTLPSGFRVRFSGPDGETEAAARSVVGAWGRWNTLDLALERRFLRRRNAFLGWSRDFVGATEFLAGRVHLYLFPGGYCGLSRVEGGEINLAGVVSEPAYGERGGGWQAVLNAARRGNRALAADLDRLDPGPRGFLGVGPVFITRKPAVEADILMVGDAAGVIDPFSGQGQAAALHAGLLAADIAASFLSGVVPAGSVAAEYRERWRDAFGQRFAWSAVFRDLMLDPRLGRIAGRLAGRKLVRFAIARVGGRC
jgi:flavin-dependent dehydrogenase